jgi:hypothetical protein
MTNRAPIASGINRSPARWTTWLAASTLVSASDPDGDPIATYQFWDQDSGGGFFTVNGVAQGDNVAITVAAADIATARYQLGSTNDTLWVRASDGFLWSEWQSLTVSAPQNHAPDVIGLDQTPTRGTTSLAALSLVNAADPDGDAILTYQFWDPTADGGHFTINGVAQGDNLAITVAAADMASARYKLGSTSDTLWVRASDGLAWSEWQPLSVTVPQNNAPTVAGINQTPGRGTASIAASSLLNASDADGDPIVTYQFWDQDAGGGYFTVNGGRQGDNVAITVAAANIATARYQLGSTNDTLWVRASDGMAWSEWTSLTVAALQNHVPDVSGHDREASTNASLAVATLFTASDLDGDSIAKYQFWDSAEGGGRFVVSGTSQAANSVVEVMAGQLATASFATGSAEGTDLIWARAFDGIAWSEWQSSTVTTLANRAPTVAGVDQTPARGITTLTAASLLSASDPDGHSIVRYAFWDLTPGNGFFRVNGVAQTDNQRIEVSALDLANTQFVLGAPSSSDSLRVAVYDGQSWSAFDDFVVTAPSVPPVVAPTAAGDAAQTNEDQSVTIAVLANDNDGGGQSLNVSAVTQGSHGSVSINANGTLRYTPHANYSGADSFTYTISNGVGTATGSVSVTVAPVNDPPVAQDDGGLSTRANTAKTISAQTLLANDTDIDGNVLSIASVMNPVGGTVALVGGNIVFTPTAGFTGTARFDYTVSDGRGGQDVGRATLSVVPNAAPVAADDSSSGSGYRIIHVLLNDSDADGDPLSITGFTQAQHGSLTLNPDRTFTYVPVAGYVGADSFTYTLSDGSASDTAAVNITVSAPPSASFLQRLANAPEQSWVRLNINAFSEVWAPSNLRPSFGTPARVIGAWGSMAWDPNRGDLIFWGGGHANYGGNEVYRWHSSTLSWERASLPSQIVSVSGARYEAIDGVDNAPIAAHTYDNSEFLPIADRFMTFGGAAYNTGGAFVDSSGNAIGPYFWDPSKGDPNKVGGTTGSAVGGSTSIVGGQMWENRDSFPSSGGRPGDRQNGFVGGVTAYTQENGKDVIYVSDGNLWKYTINDVNNAALDTYEKVGIYWNSYLISGAGAIDPERNVFVRTSGSAKFTYWDLNQAGGGNKNQLFVPTDASGLFDFSELPMYGIDYDPVRNNFVLWNGDPEIWVLTPPTTLSTTGWTLTRNPLSSLTDVPHQNDGLGAGQYFAGTFGKWKYIPEHDIFLGVIDQNLGTVWAYKPGDWQPASLTTMAMADLLAQGVPQSSAAGLAAPTGTTASLTTAGTEQAYLAYGGDNLLGA